VTGVADGVADGAVISAERPDSPDGRRLIEELDAHLGSRYPPSSRHAFGIDRLIEERVAFFVLRSRGTPAACGGILFVDRDASASAYGEVKRMYVDPAFRGRGFGKRILARLADEATARGIHVLRLETGVHQAEAIGLYEATGFRRIGPFGPYIDDPLCVYFELRLDIAAAATSRLRDGGASSGREG
jgi:putative acetyltransferase